jgi:hypothetical protein
VAKNDNYFTPLLHESSDEDEESTDEQYVVQRIVKHRKDKSNTSSDGYEYSVKWEGYNKPTWEPSNSFLGGADQILKEYRVSQNLSVIDDSDAPETIEGVDDSEVSRE